MPASFDGVSFGERGAEARSFPVWTIPASGVVKKIPGGDKNVVQLIGIKLPRLAFIAKCTAAQLASLRGKIGVTGTFVFGFETTTATLISVGEPKEIVAGKDVYFCTLNFIRSSSTFTTPSNRWLTESGDSWITETGDFWITEA